MYVNAKRSKHIFGINSLFNLGFYLFSEIFLIKRFHGRCYTKFQGVLFNNLMFLKKSASQTIS